MASDRIGDRSESDPALVRFREASVAAASLLEAVRGPDATYADVFTQQIIRYSVEGRVTLRSGRQLPVDLRTKARLSEGAAFRRLGPRPAFSAVNGLDDDAVRDAARAVASSSEGCRSVVPEHIRTAMPPKVGDEFAACIREIADATLSVVDRCRQVKVGVAAFEKRSAVANTRDHRSESVIRRTELRVDVETAEGSLKETWVEWDTNRPPSAPPSEIAWGLQRRAERLGESVPDCPESAAILLPPGWGGTWMHEAVGHLLEADTALTYGSALHERRGSRVAASSVTVVDDGTLRPSRVAQAYDDEGVATGTTPLIDKGIVVGLLTDRATAARTGLPLTGNGRRPHFGLPPRPRMSNLILRPDAASREEMISAAGTLIVVDRVGHAWVDVKDGVLHIEIEEASLCEGGEPPRFVGRLIASAEPLQLLDRVAAVGRDFALDMNRGYCLKDGAALPVTIGQPSVLLRSMQIRPAPPS